MGLLKRIQFWPYLFFVVWSLAVFLIISFFGLSPWSMILTFFLLISLPGFSLARIFRIKFNNDQLGQVVLYFVIGLVWSFSLALIAIIFGLTLDMITFIYLLSLFLLFMTSLMFEVLRPNEEKIGFNFKRFFNWEIILLIVSIVAIISVLNVLDQRGANFKGDPYFHLAIMRKAVDGQPLTMANLSYVRDKIHPAYAFPVWHVFMSMIVKIFNSNIFTVWREMIVSLTIFSIFIWYWLLRRVINNKAIALFALMLFVAVTFQWDHGYLFSRLPVPDTLGQLIFLPLLVGLAYKYVFEENPNYKLIITITLLAIFTVIVHPTQYFYYLIFEFVFLVIYLIFNFKNAEQRVKIKNFFYLLVSNLVALVPLFLLYQQGSGTVSNTMESFSKVNITEVRYEKFSSLLPFSKISYFITPILALICFKNRRYLFVVALLAIMPIVYWIDPIKRIVIKYLGLIFANRLYGNLAWDFLVWGVIIGFVVVLIDRLFARLLVTKTIRYAVTILFAGILAILFWAQWYGSGGFVSDLYNSLFPQSLSDLLDKNSTWLILSSLVVAAAALLLLKYKPKLKEGIEIGPSFKNPLISVLILSIITLIFFATEMKTMYGYWYKAFNNHHFVKVSADNSYSVIRPSSLGGLETIEFVATDVPAKSVFVSNKGYFMLPVVADQHMAAYSGSAATKYDILWKNTGSFDEKMALIRSDRAKYLLYIDSESRLSWPEDYPEYFTKVFENKSAVIYRVN